MSRRDLVLGAVDRYGWPEIRNWALSLDASGFTGRKAVVAYRIADGTVAELERRGIEVFRAGADPLGRPIPFPADGTEHPGLYHLRFFHWWQVLVEQGAAGLGRVLATDVRDVVFQRDPSAWLDARLAPHPVVVASEGLRVRDSPWSRDNFLAGFGPLLFRHLPPDRVIANAGVVAGEADHVARLALLIFLVSEGQTPGSDQAALNLLLAALPAGSVRLAASEDAWVCNAGTLADPRGIARNRPHLLEPEPRLCGGVVTTGAGEPYHIVHQYDRVPEWRRLFDARFA